jgi:HK97 family phage major capsid protein
MSLQTFREQRATLAKEIRRMADTLQGEKKEFDASERGNWDKLNKDYDSIKNTIETMERASAIDAEMVESAKEFGSRPGDEGFAKAQKRAAVSPERLARSRALALQAWAVRGTGKDLTEEQATACRELGVNPNAEAFNFRLLSRPDVELRTQSVGTTTAGGFTVPQGFVYNLEVALKEYNSVRGVADVMRTDTGNAMPWPQINDTSVSGRLLAENTAITNTAMAFTSTTFNAYKYSSDSLLISSELMEDSAFDLERELGQLLGVRLARIQGAHFTTGTGSSQPAGVVVGSTLGKTAAGAAAITADELIDLLYSVDPAYRTGPKVGFMAHDNIIAAIRKLKDSSGQYLWNPSPTVGLVGGQPDSLLGFPVYRNNFMQSSIATATKTVLFGDFSKYKIRDVNDFRLVRMNERYADSDQVGFVAFVRSDAKLLNAGMGPVKHLLQA